MTPRRRTAQEDYEYFPFDEDRPRKKRKSGCFWGLAALIVLILGVLVIRGASRRAHSSSPATQPSQTQTGPIAALPSLELPATATLTRIFHTATLESPPQTPVITAPTSTTLPLTSQPPFGQIDQSPFTLPELTAYMLDLINTDRQANGLAPVAWDGFAAQVGQTHAEEMAANNYLSHWNLAGQGPNIRYGLAGGMDLVMENVASYYQRYDNGTPVPVFDWQKLVFDSQQGLMESPGHRKNILDPAHTHVGIGIAYNPATGEFRLAQEFLNRYLELEPLPQAVSPGETFVVKGKLMSGASDPLINLLYEPFPTPLTVAQLNRTSTYESPAVFLDAVQPTLDNRGNFEAQIRLWPGAKPGLYHIVVWVDVSGEQVPGADIIVSLN